MVTLVDDVGSFPLPASVDAQRFAEVYRSARKSVSDGKKADGDESLFESFRHVVLDCFLKKLRAGLDVVNYPQVYDMADQLADVVREAMGEGTYSITKERAVLPEVAVISDEAKMLSEEAGEKLKLRVCIIGPVELYLKMMGPVIHKDVLQAFAENVRRFAENSILNSKYIETFSVSLDEPSFGFQDLVADRETIATALETALGFAGPVRQIHLHSPSRMTDLLNVKGVDVLSVEYAASPGNIESVSKRMLQQADKQIRVGISRTDINSILAELYEKGITKPTAEQMVEDERTIGKRFESAKAKYGELMTFTGPDCGLGGWPTQEAAQLLLTRTVKAVKTAKNDP